MMKILLPISVLVLTLTVLIPQANAFSSSERLEDFEQLVSWIKADYGPLTFKEEQLKFDFAQVTESYREKFRGEISDEDFRYLLAKYVGEFHDAHFSLKYNTTATAKLGFTTDLIQGRVLIDSIDRTLLPVPAFPFERGDEVLALDSRPALSVARDIEEYLNVSYDLTGLHLAVNFLGMRKASRMPLPTGAVDLLLKHQSSGVEEHLNLKWQTPPPQLFKALVPWLLSAPAALNHLPIGLADLCSETSRIHPPVGAAIVPDVPFTAFTFPSERGLIGFIRIPHDYPVDAKGNEIAQLRFSQYEKIVAEFEKTTIGLIIDQDFNCGGSVVYVNKLFSLFYGESFVPQRFAFRASQTQIEGLTHQLGKFTPQDDGFTEFQDVIAKISQAFHEGKRMTEPLPMRGFMEVKLDLPGGNLIQPNPIHYTKPIVMLINELSGSGGDVFPSLMQDYGRAKLLGTRTMGAGGHLWDDPDLVLPHSHAVISLTRSLIYRKDGRLIENAGIEPDFQYEITVSDFMNGYQNYLKTAERQLLELVN